MELFDHVSIHLDVVPFGLDISYLLLVEFEAGFELGSWHGFPLIVRLLFFLWFFGPHPNTITYKLLK